MHVILGAGLAGLSLACALVREGVDEPIVIVDRRTTFDRDRTWCTWAVPGVPFLELATHSWDRWEVRTAERSGHGGSTRHPYVHLPSDAFYAAALERLDRAPNVELRLGEAVTEVGDGWARTDHSTYAGTTYDGLALGSPALRGRPPGDLELWQSFVGWEVETEDARFVPGTATLMDFRTPQPDAGVAFLYVLPFSATRALVEHTSFSRSPPAAEDHRAALLGHLQEGGPFTRIREEDGRLLMTTAALPARRSPHTAAIGTAGGALRASSGYAFSRVQAHVAAVARSVARGRPLPARAGDARRAALDAVFLQALDDDPAAFPEVFRALVDGVGGDAFARFMADASSLADEARVIAACPTLPFARALAGHAWTRAGRLRP